VTTRSAASLKGRQLPRSALLGCDPAEHDGSRGPAGREGRRERAHLAYAGHALMEHHNGLFVAFLLTQTTGPAGRDVVPDLIDRARERGYRPRTPAGDSRQCVADLLAHHSGRRPSAIDRRTTCHAGSGISQRKRKRVEEIAGGFRRTRFLGLRMTQLAVYRVAHRLQPCPHRATLLGTCGGMSANTSSRTTAAVCSLALRQPSLRSLPGRLTERCAREARRSRPAVRAELIANPTTQRGARVRPVLRRPCSVQPSTDFMTVWGPQAEGVYESRGLLPPL
jgi:hypothetical protein